MILISFPRPYEGEGQGEGDIKGTKALRKICLLLKSLVIYCLSALMPLYSLNIAFDFGKNFVKF